MKRLLFKILYNLQILRLFPQFYFHYEVRKYIKKDDVVLDIGANQGIYTRIFSNSGTKVYAVEPISKFWSMLLKDSIVMPFALGDDTKMVCLDCWRNTSGAYRISEKGIVAQMVNGSKIFKHLDKINFIKIDVEGSELPIIEDMKDLILKHKPTILIETGVIDKVLEYLKGYKIKDTMFNDYLLESQ